MVLFVQNTLRGRIRVDAIKTKQGEEEDTAGHRQETCLVSNSSHVLIKKKTDAVSRNGQKLAER